MGPVSFYSHSTAVRLRGHGGSCDGGEAQGSGQVEITGQGQADSEWQNPGLSGSLDAVLTATLRKASLFHFYSKGYKS